MKRRDFIKTSAIAGASLLIPWETIALTKENDFLSNEEKNKLIYTYFNRIFNSSIDSNISTPTNRYLFADSFEIAINNEKNTIFDFTDEIIELGHNLDEDWSCLKKGTMPINLKTGNGTLKITKDNGSFQLIKFDKLKMHDATLRLHNYVQVLSYSPPAEWHKIKKLKTTETDLYTILNGKLKGERFRVWKKDIEERKLNIEQYKPTLHFKNRHIINFHKLTTLRKLIKL